MNLPELLRPRKIEEFVGQEHLLGEGKFLRKYIFEEKRIFHFLIWGPPGTGKTSFALIIKDHLGLNFYNISAVDTTLKDLKLLISQIKKAKTLGKESILFIDEIHRFNKSVQSFLLPYIEKRDFYLIGATTENPSFEIISPLLSRIKVLIFYPLKKEKILKILKKALYHPEVNLSFKGIEIEESVLEKIAEASQGDAREALKTLELLLEYGKACLNEKGLSTYKLTLENLPEEMLFKPLFYDKTGEEHYNLISAFHKSMRGSDPDATVYYLARMLKAGEDPLYIARRIVICAAEDVGLANPMALLVAQTAKDAFEFLGQPEGEIALAMAAIYVALSPKSNSAYKALKLAEEEVEKTGPLPVPLHLRNPVTTLMKKLGYGKDYKYPHDYPHSFVPQTYLPEKLKNKQFYIPSEEDRIYFKYLAKFKEYRTEK